MALVEVKTKTKTSKATDSWPAFKCNLAIKASVYFSLHMYQFNLHREVCRNRLNCDHSIKQCHNMALLILACSMDISTFITMGSSRHLLYRLKKCRLARCTH